MKNKIFNEKCKYCINCSFSFKRDEFICKIHSELKSKCEDFAKAKVTLSIKSK